jgi:hypothetical protein
MPAGEMVLYVFCGCKHTGKFFLHPDEPHRLAEYWLRRLRCSKCRGRPTDIRYVWDVNAPSVAEVVPISSARRAD